MSGASGEGCGHYTPEAHGRGAQEQIPQRLPVPSLLLAPPIDQTKASDTGAPEATTGAASRHCAEGLPLPRGPHHLRKLRGDLRRSHRGSLVAQGGPGSGRCPGNVCWVCLCQEGGGRKAGGGPWCLCPAPQGSWRASPAPPCSPRSRGTCCGNEAVPFAQQRPRFQVRPHLP